MKMTRLLVFSFILCLSWVLTVPSYAQGEYYLNSDGEMELLYDAGNGNKLTQDGEFLINTDQDTYRGDQYLNDGGYEYYR